MTKVIYKPALDSAVPEMGLEIVFVARLVKPRGAQGSQKPAPPHR